MIKLEDLRAGMRVCGLAADNRIVKIIQVEPFGLSGLGRGSRASSYRVVFEDDNGKYGDVTLFSSDDLSLQEAEEELICGKDAELACLVWEAKRISNAYLFDKYHAIFASEIDPLPHQIEAVYGNMLRRHPLRFLLADDPGAGKTIMAGLLIREMMARDIVRRCLIVVPGNLCEQWRTELDGKFRLDFTVGDLKELKHNKNGLNGHDGRHDLLIVRMDQAKRKDYRELLEKSQWDLLICDEAHKMSAKQYGNKIDPTKRYQLGQLLSGRATHVLLMTATPHNGRDGDYRLFLQLLDADRFERRYREKQSEALRTLKERAEQIHYPLERLVRDRVEELGRRNAGRQYGYYPRSRSWVDDLSYTQAIEELDRIQAEREALEKKIAVAQAAYDRSVDNADIKLRRMKEELVTIEGKPLFTERKAYTANFGLSYAEQDLYDKVTEYCREEFNKAEALEGRGRNAVGFAMTIMQRRLASSPEAIYQSLKNRRMRLEGLLLEYDSEGALPKKMGLLGFNVEDYEDLPAEEQEKQAEELVGMQTASRTRAELVSEIAILRRLEWQADEVRRSDRDSKWEKLREIWKSEVPEMAKAGRPRKLILFTEHVATLNYLVEKLGVLLGDMDAVVTIHGGVNSWKRREIQNQFWYDPKVQIMVATDAAGEGINLHCAHLMVNYDLPWNPNRLEQRFGRIHRIGQTEVCHLWNLVAPETREGAVFESLFEKLVNIGSALDGKVFDVLGESFQEKSLRALMVDAIRYGDDPKRKEEMERVIDDVAKRTERMQELSKHVLTRDVINVKAILDDPDYKKAGQMQTRDTLDFLRRAFAYLSPNGASIREMGDKTYKIDTVPGAIYQHASRNDDLEKVSRGYSRVCFARQSISPQNRARRAEFIGQDHPLLKATLSCLQEKWRKMRPECGELLPALVTEGADGNTMRCLYYLEWTIENAVEDGPSVIEREALFVEVDTDGAVKEVEARAYLDYRPAAKQESPLIQALLERRPLHKNAGLVSLAKNYASEHLRGKLEEIREREIERLEREEMQVRESLLEEIRHHDSQIMKHRFDERLNPGMQVYKASRAQAEQHKDKLEARLENRMRKIELQRTIQASAILVELVAVLVPSGLLVGR